MNSVFEPSFSARRLVEADRRRTARAFDHWCKLQGRAERGSNVDSSALFYDAVEKSLDLTRDKVPKSLKIPTGRSGWSNWRLGKGKPTTKIRFDVCWAVWVLTNIDVTSNGFLQHVPVNATEMVRLGKTVHRSSEAQYGSSDIVIETLHFAMSSSKDVWLSDAKSRPAPHDKTIRIGAVRYGLREASIGVQSSEIPQTLLTQLNNSECSDLGSAKGATLFVDPDEVSKWRVQPPINAEVLEARFDNLRLVRSESGLTPMSVSVSVSESDIYPSMSLDETSPHIKKLSARDRELARKRLIEQILRHRLLDNGSRRRYVLSHGKAQSQ